MSSKNLKSFINNIKENDYATAKTILGDVLEEKFNEYIDNVEEAKGDN
jgi:DNA gyrase/topoisomerase IV subunit B